jgi:hypothetical protein
MVAGALDLERKGLDLALHAVSLARDTVPDASLILVGDWIDAGRRNSLPDFCEARGRLDPGEVQAAFAVAGCCLIPSLWEEFGYSGIEALATGIPVACTPLPGYEGLSGGGVFRAMTREPAHLAKEMVSALDASSFEFPAECRASVAVPRILNLYESAFGADCNAGPGGAFHFRPGRGYHPLHDPLRNLPHRRRRDSPLRDELQRPER